MVRFFLYPSVICRAIIVVSTPLDENCSVKVSQFTAPMPVSRNCLSPYNFILPDSLFRNTLSSWAGLFRNRLSYLEIVHPPPLPPPQSQTYIKHNHVNNYCIPHTKHMDGEEYNDMVRFLESKDDKHRTWPRGGYKNLKIRRQKGHIARNAKTLPLMTVFCLRRTGGSSMRLKRCRL